MTLIHNWNNGCSIYLLLWPGTLLQMFLLLKFPERVVPARVRKGNHLGFGLGLAIAISWRITRSLERKGLLAVRLAGLVAHVTAAASTERGESQGRRDSNSRPRNSCASPLLLVKVYPHGACFPTRTIPGYWFRFNIIVAIPQFRRHGPSSPQKTCVLK